MITAKLVNKINMGDRISNKELLEAITHYREVEKLLSPMGERYHLTRVDITRTLYRLEDYAKARKLKL